MPRRKNESVRPQPHPTHYAFQLQFGLTRGKLRLPAPLNLLLDVKADRVPMEVIPRVYVRQPVAEDERAFLAAARRSRALHRPWTSAPDTAAKFRAYLERMATPASRAYLVCRSDTNELVGVINLSNVVLGLFRSGHLGYYAFSGHERQGFMRQGLRAVVRDAFGSLKLHRLEANIQPANVGSIALVKSCGFSREGPSPRYLKIGGRWRDHERWAVLAS